MPLTPGQQNALDSLTSVVLSPTTQVALLTGYAGTGKTFTLARLVDRLRSLRKRVIVAAPTHKAARCLDRALAGMGVSYADVCTVARILKLRRVRDLNTGKETFEPPPDLPPWKGDVLIIDESSMIAASHYEALRRILEPEQTLIFVGDPAQVPPVDDGVLCAAFTDIEHRCQLTEVVRHQGPILSLATETRQVDVGRGFYRTSKGPESIVMAHGGRERWEKAFLDAACTPEALADPDRVRAVCFTNEHVDELNAKVRRLRYGAEAAPFCEGELLMASKAIPDPSSDTGYPLVYSSAEMVVVKAEDFRSPVLHDELDWVAKAHNGKRSFYAGDTEVPPWRYWRLLVELETGRKLRFCALDPSEKDRWDKTRGKLYKLAREAKTTEERKQIHNVIFRREDQFGKVQAAAALTVHKSQGSTFKRVWLHYDTDGWDGPPLPIFNRLAYVGITRASEELHVVADF